jgi:hypothetical protein
MVEQKFRRCPAEAGNESGVERIRDMTPKPGADDQPNGFI